MRILIALSILGASILSSAAVYFTVAPWKIEYANDVGKYYGARMALSQENNLADLIIAPFYRTLTDSSVEAPQTKPVYMAVLNVGYAIYDVFYPGQPNRKPFFTFTMFTFWLLFLTVCLVGWRFGHPFLGILTAMISLIGPWSFVYLYYPAYTQFSMVFSSPLVFMHYMEPTRRRLENSGRRGRLRLAGSPVELFHDRLRVRPRRVHFDQRAP